MTHAPIAVLQVFSENINYTYIIFCKYNIHLESVHISFFNCLRQWRSQDT